MVYGFLGIVTYVALFIFPDLQTGSDFRNILGKVVLCAPFLFFILIQSMPSSRWLAVLAAILTVLTVVLGMGEAQYAIENELPHFGLVEFVIFSLPCFGIVVGTITRAVALYLKRKSQSFTRRVLVTFVGSVVLISPYMIFFMLLKI